MEQPTSNTDGDHLDSFLLENGYKIVRKICDTTQGVLYEANHTQIGRVAIKKTNKLLHKSHESRIDCDGMTNIVATDITREASLLYHLTVKYTDMSDYITQFHSFFENDDNYYLVTEYVPFNLSTFASKAHEYIRNGRLKIKEWKKIVKFIFWQLSVLLNWLHSNMHCCHLDLSLNNILLKNARFIPKNNNKRRTSDKVTIDKSICVNLCGFGLSESFFQKQNVHTKSGRVYTNEPQVPTMTSADVDIKKTLTSFECSKFVMSDDENYKSPQVFAEEMYDARKADVWSFGILLYCVSVGQYPYTYQCQFSDERYEFLYKKQIGKVIEMDSYNTFVDADLLELLGGNNGMLCVNEKERILFDGILKTKWFSLYYKTYYNNIVCCNNNVVHSANHFDFEHIMQVFREKNKSVN